MTTAMVRCLRTRFPKARIDYAVRADFLDLIRANPHITNKYTIDRKEGIKALWKFRKEVNKTGYDLIYDAHRSLRTRILMPFLKSKYKAYYQKHYIRRALALTFKLRILNSVRFLEKFVEPLLPFGVTYDGGGPEMFVNGPEKLVPPQGRPWIGLIPSAQWPGKRWPIENFKALAAKIINETLYGIIIFGGREDTFCQEIIEGLPKERIVDAQGRLSIMESSQLLKHCQFVVANDTGLMHVADALNIPSVLFLGPTSATLGCLPFHSKTVVLEHDLWCRPCSKNGEAPCIRKERYCLTRTTVDQTFRALPL